MWITVLVFTLLSVKKINSVVIESVNETKTFVKCCPLNQNLIKVPNNETFDSYYQCVNSEDAKSQHGINQYPLLFGDKLTVSHGFPVDCDIEELTEATDNALTAENNFCYDRLVLESVNETLINIPRIIALICEDNKTAPDFDLGLSIKHISKCCPKGQGYDLEYHMCRDIEDSNNEGLMSTLRSNNYHVYEMDEDLLCKTDEYALELSGSKYSFEIHDSQLKVTRGNDENWISEKEWCIDQEYGSTDLVARVCVANCSNFGAFCVRKCCPVGYHYQPKSCSSLISYCVPNYNEKVFFNISTYLAPLREEEDFPDVLGIRTNIFCSRGKFVLNASSEDDSHYLTRDGRLISQMNFGPDYCIEAFYRSTCGTDYLVTALQCFVAAPDVKNFNISFVVNCLSSICLALTLFVYCALPELRNLHGYTLICHASTMMLAYCCLARAQYDKVENKVLCVTIGYGIYFGFVAAFFWLNVMCLDIWWTFGSVRSVQPLRKASAERRRFLWYSLYAWSVALLLTLTVFLFDKFPPTRYLDAEMGKNKCWFGSEQNTKRDWPHYIFFVVPMGLLSCVNFILWILTARHCARVKSEVHRLQAGSVGDRAKTRFRVDRAKYLLTGKLWVVMGAGWVSELLATLYAEPQWLWNIVDLINELQGVFIFLILIFKPKLYYLIKKRLGLEKPDPIKNGTSSTARTSTTFVSRTISSDERTHLRSSLPQKLL